MKGIRLVAILLFVAIFMFAVCTYALAAPQTSAPTNVTQFVTGIEIPPPFVFIRGPASLYNAPTIAVLVALSAITVSFGVHLAKRVVTNGGRVVSGPFGLWSYRANDYSGRHRTSSQIKGSAMTRVSASRGRRG